MSEEASDWDKSGVPKEHYDLLVVGAGIQGAGVAQAAAAKGWSVLVVERRAEAGLETSSASSKLIHGGLRYLETGQLRLVYECLRERQLLLRNAPSLVKIKPFYLPVYRSSSRSAVWIRLGLTLYGLLGGFAPYCRHRRVPRVKWRDLGIKTEGLVAVYQYFDGQTDDRRLTQSVLNSALAMGAKVSFETEIQQCTWQDCFRIQLSTGARVSARAVVNAAGPWVNAVAKQVPGAPQTDLDWVQGTHIVLPVTVPGCFYLESPIDGRAVFILPWHGQTLVGTTETPLQQPQATPQPEEVAYLLDAFNHYFPLQACTRELVVAQFAGTRVLPADERQGALNRRSRETLVLKKQVGSSIYLAVYGGKLTSYRSSAQKVIVALLPALGKPPRVGNTADIPINF